MRPKSTWPTWLIKLFLPEYWGSTVIYAVPFLYVIWNSLRLKNKFYPVLLNPAIDDQGGFIGTSKTHINSLFPQNYFPKSMEFEGAGEQQQFIEIVATEIGFPCFVKPDDLYRGIGVEKIENAAELDDYLQRYPVKCYVQGLLSQPMEYGVFISRLPGEKVKILSLTSKIFLTVTGDGKSNIGELLSQNIRYKMAKSTIDAKWQRRFEEIPESGKTILIQPVGNHNKGTYFGDASDAICPEMEILFDTIVPKDGIYYGRFDVKAENLDSLKTGNGLGIIEFNGTIAEPVSYCDPQYSFLEGQKIIMRHYREQLKIARVLLHQGAVAPGLLEGIRIVRKARRFKAAKVFTFNGQKG
jgi:hypothetical protein